MQAKSPLPLCKSWHIDNPTLSLNCSTLPVWCNEASYSNSCDYLQCQPSAGCVSSDNSALTDQYRVKLPVQASLHQCWFWSKWSCGGEMPFPLLIIFQCFSLMSVISSFFLRETYHLRVRMIYFWSLVGFSSFTLSCTCCFWWPQKPKHKLFNQ